MRKAVFLGFLKVAMLALVICSVIFSLIIGEYMKSRTVTDLEYSVKLIDYGLDYKKNLQSQIDVLNPIVYSQTSRITIIALDGKVLADTSRLIDYDDNHSNRAEVKDAVKDGMGVNIRHSNTLKQDLMYVAFYSERGDCVVRLAIPYNGLTAFSRAIVPGVFISIVIAFIIAFIFAKRLSETITEPLDEISRELLKIQNNGHIISFKRYDYEELNNIVRSTETLSERIENQMQLLKDENCKMDSILNNMNEGLILVDNSGEVVVINKMAQKILGCKDIKPGKNIVCYTQNLKIIEGFSNTVKNLKETYFDLKTEGKTYVLHISKVEMGVLILFIDVTYERASQSIRQDFFSDASHELKTPITSINGYAELLTSGIEYTKEMQTEFLNRIKNEARNMTGLINDILMISRMESDTNDNVNRENMNFVNVGKIIEDILKVVEPIAQDIVIESDFDDILIRADYNHLYQLINNLVVNAIKYNKPKGEVYISAKVKDNNLEIEVKDTGIGIPLEYQNRVFERFFRVDKGRSKKMGGTGLGLAIVKHIVNFYKGSIFLKSKLNKGTDITVKIPM
ncbi:MAG: ATP-binding protein [Lachnospirales bacterium]